MYRQREPLVAWAPLMALEVWFKRPRPLAPLRPVLPALALGRVLLIWQFRLPLSELRAPVLPRLLLLLLPGASVELQP